ncbi:MAG: nuclear transport factor 2 family protein [Candidatus Thiodiazotropha sp.]|jgi:hypothetical protein
MTDRELTLTYLRLFATGDIEGLGRLLSPELRFRGTLHSFDSAADYLESLRTDPPEPTPYRLLSVTDDKDTVALFYEYLKPERPLLVAQLFRISQQRISSIDLAFDSCRFMQQAKVRNTDDS